MRRTYETSNQGVPRIYARHRQRHNRVVGIDYLRFLKDRKHVCADFPAATNMEEAVRVYDVFLVRVGCYILVILAILKIVAVCSDSSRMSWFNTQSGLNPEKLTNS